MSTEHKDQYALISLTDKSNIAPFAAELSQLGIEILSTGGTAALLREHQVAVTEVSDFTGYPELFEGRVKTLHPKIHGGILFKRQKPSHVSESQNLGIKPIDLVVVNLYSFARAAADASLSLPEVMERIDIGGPTLIRAAAKNFHDVTVIVDPRDYDMVLDELKTNGTTSLKTRFALARKVFSHIVAYDAAISRWLTNINFAQHPYFKDLQDA